MTSAPAIRWPSSQLSCSAGLGLANIFGQKKKPMVLVSGIIGTVLASLIICILRYGLPLCFGVSTQNLDLPIGLILVVVVLGREIAGQHMLSHLFKRRRKE